MLTVYLVLLILSALAFALRAAGVRASVDLLAVGLFLWVMVPLIQTLRAV